MIALQNKGEGGGRVLSSWQLPANLRENFNDNHVIIVTFTKLKYLIVKETFIPYHSYTKLVYLVEEGSHICLISLQR